MVVNETGENEVEKDGFEHVYARLSPDCVLDAVESLGVQCDGRLLALNSYENRVYQVGIEGQAPLIAKFYRPERWTDEAILEEHEFSFELYANDVPVVPPIADAQGKTLHYFNGFRFSIFVRQGGRAPALDDGGHLALLGRFVARLHNQGALKPFKHRRTMTIDFYARQSATFLLDSGFIPVELEAAYSSLARDLITEIEAGFARAGELNMIRLHGDMHAGNILWTDDGPHLVDLDDVVMGPAIQDLWMFLSGERDYMQGCLLDLIAGYEDFREFDARELHLIEPLRAMRMMHYAAWLARRWDDPAFPAAFPWFNSRRYWDEHVLSLREQLARMAEPVLRLMP